LEPREHASEIEAWRRRRIDRLTSEDGWLSLTGFFWLSDGENAVGSDSSSAVPLPSGKAPSALGILRVSGRLVVFEPWSGAVVEADGHPVAGSVALRSDAAGEPTLLAFGSLRLHIVERGGRIAARVRDIDSPARRELRPIDAFAVSPAWRFDAAFEPYAPSKRIPFTSVLGTVEPEISPGAVVFSATGRILRLDPVLERGEADLWIVFGDLTNGVETYPGGRFVYVSPPVGGRTVLDFNKAYNPPCVFTPFSTCPLPPVQNRLPIRIEAGEKTYR
jgi:hypothetical protein